VDDQGHVPVLCEEVLRALEIHKDGVYLDATFGRGGHAEEILKQLGPEGRLFTLDRDPRAVEVARDKFSSDVRVRIDRGSFSMLGKIIENHGLAGKVKGVLFDLGVSSPQLQDPNRGFSFRHDGPLDMRMDPSSGFSAAEWLNRVAEDDLSKVIRDYGEERYARRVARAIVRSRREQPIATTGLLAEIVARAVPTREPGQHPATRTFQAIRIHINRELDELKQALPQAVMVLAPGGRLVVISFHSLEDRMVKRFFRTEAKGGDHPPGLPLREEQLRPRLRLIGKPVRASVSEVKQNPRARSATLRVAERSGLPYE
jgi:16S rRNA (cytosine1402-N4)-methyltransferase